MRHNRGAVGGPDMSNEASIIHSIVTVAMVMGIGALIAFFASSYF